MSLEAAVAQHQAGDRIAAERLYRRALAVRPNDPAVLHGFGVLCHETGRESEALTLIGRACQLAPGVAQYAANLGGVLSRFRRYDQAIAHLAHALKLDPGHQDAARNLALTLIESGQSAKAVRPLTALLRMSPQRADLWRLLGRAERQASQPLRGALAYQRAIQLAPQDYRAWDGLGLCLDDLGDGESAARAYQRALAAKPDETGVLCHLGLALRRQHRFAEALAAAGRAIACEPARAEAHHLLGTIRHEAGDMLGAANHYRRAIELSPGAIETRSNLASVLVRLDEYGPAIVEFRAVLAGDPNHESASAGLYGALRAVYDWKAADALEPHLAAQTAGALAAGKRPAETPLAFLSRTPDPAAALPLAAAWTADHARRAQSSLKRPAHPAHERLRLAYLSSDFRDHAVAQLSAAVFGLHDRSRFEVFAYGTNVDDGSAPRRRIVEGVERFVDAGGLGDRQLATRIAEDGIDILIDMNGITAANRLGVLALRAAPIQACWLGFPGTTGAPFIDYLIADAVVAPPEHQHGFAERLCRLPHCYLPHDPGEKISGLPVSRTDCGLPAQGIVFCSFNQPQKLDPATFEIWCGLLSEFPGGVLWLHDRGQLACDNLRRAAAKRGIDPSRLVFADKPDKPRHLARLALADIALDTRAYNGHTTTLDALYVGVPVVAQLGTHFASRVAASALAAAGLPELIARNGDEYRRIAHGLAGDANARGLLRARLAAARNSAPLFDAMRFTRNLERGYEIMVARHRQGETPAPIDVQEGA
jgi:protein O-GlcNAc transferase